MAASYSKDFLIAAYMFRFCEANVDSKLLEDNASRYYDEVGKDKFREAASLDAAEVARYRAFIDGYSSKQLDGRSRNFCLDIVI